MNIKNYPNNRNEFVGAETLMKFLHGRSSGVFALDDAAAVTAKQSQMAVNVSDGYGWLTDAEKNGCVWWVDTKKETGQLAELSIDPADSVLGRIDRVIVEWTTTLYTELPQLKILKGTNSSNPQPPALTNNTNTRQISLAKIRIPAGTTFISPSMITDERLDRRVCGLVTFDTSIDTTTMQEQFQAMLESVNSESQNLLDSIQNELAQIVGGTGFDPVPIRKNNIIIRPSDFNTYRPENSEEAGLHNDLGFIYRAKIQILNVIESMTPYVTLSLPDVDKSGVSIANQFACYNGGIIVYADGYPNSNITALTVECRKAV